MFSDHLKLLRFLAPLLAIYFVAYWWLLPGKLEQTQSTEVVVSASLQTSLRSGDRAVLTQENGQSLRVPCGQVRALCLELEKRSLTGLQVWLSPANAMHEPRVVAVIQNGQPLISAAEQNKELESAKLVSAIVALAAMLACAVLWYFGPFKTLPTRADAA